MYVTYNNLFKLLIDKGLNKTEFAREVGISSNTGSPSSRKMSSSRSRCLCASAASSTVRSATWCSSPRPSRPIKSGLERMKKRRPTHEKGGNAYRHE